MFSSGFSIAPSQRRARPAAPAAFKGMLWLIAVLSLLGCLRAGGAQAQAGKGQPRGTARAQKEGAESVEYRAAIERGLEEYQLGNFQEARDQFARAHALHPNARTLRGLGFTAFELRNYVEAESSLQAALDSREKPLEGTLRRETEEMLARAQSYVGSITLQLQPATAVLTVDGIRSSPPASDGPSGGPNSLRLDVGDHVLELRAEGFVAERRAVRVSGGQTQSLQIVLTRLPSGADSVPSARNTERSIATPIYKRWWLWTAVGVVVAAAAAGAAIALTRKQTTEYRGTPSDQTPDGAGVAVLRTRQ